MGIRDRRRRRTESDATESAHDPIASAADAIASTGDATLALGLVINRLLAEEAVSVELAGWSVYL